VRLFFYGTLMQGTCNDVATALHRRLEAGVPATAPGRLYAIPDPAGWYPAFIPDPAGAAVHGMVHAAGPGFAQADLAALDAYEDYRPADPAGSLYLRRPLTVSSAGEDIGAQAYIYNAVLPAGARPIACGDFRTFLAAHGLPEFR